MSALLDELYGDQLGVLGSDRRSHSLAVGRKAAAFGHLVVASARSDLVAAATLHDIGYGHSATGFHPVDGARYLAKSGFSTVVCHLVVHHSASRVEAQERGIDQVVFHEFEVEQDLGSAHAVLWWADMTTGPQGQPMDVEDRLNEICSRYGPDDVVTRFIGRARNVLLKAGQSPIGSIQVSA